MFVKTNNFDREELAKFLELQQLSFSILQSAASRLRGGETEKEVAQQLVKDYYWRVLPHFSPACGSFW